MKWRFFKDELEMASEASLWLEDQCKKKKIKRIYLPAGNTPIPLYKILESEKPDWLVGKSLIQVDEVINSKKSGVFRRFFEEYLPSYIKDLISPKENQFVQGEIAILGVGENGHVAFHEPGIPYDFEFGKVKLSHETIQKLELEQNAEGLTYGLGAFLNCNAILLLISGDSKKEVVRNLKVKVDMPVTQLLDHENLQIFCIENLKKE